MSEPEALNEKLSQFLQDFNSLKATLDQLKKYKNLDELSEKISLVDYAKLNSALAYALNSLYYMYMKFNGIPFEDHKINQEIERIQKYVQKIQEVVLLDNEQKRNPLRVDIEAAERHIRHHLAENQSMQEEKGDVREIMETEYDDSNTNTIAPLQESQIQPDNKKKPHKGEYYTRRG